MDVIINDSRVPGFDGAAMLLPEKTAEALLVLPEQVRRNAAEIRIGSGVFIAFADRQPDLRAADSCDIRACFSKLCRHSVYSFAGTIAQGFIPLPGGHRAGLCGTAVAENGVITGMRDISCICIRIARQICGAADKLKETVLNAEGLLIAGAPCSGKTTILRDIALALSSGRWDRPRRTALIDSRGELAAVYDGAAQLDTGGCFVLDGYPKAQGMLQAIRCLAPEYMICDEIGGREDADAVTCCANAGAYVIATVHAGSAAELCRRPQLKPLAESGAFDTVVMLRGGAQGQIEGIYGITRNTEEKENEMDRDCADTCLRVSGGKRIVRRSG